MNKNDFGYEQVEKEEHYNKVQDVFNNVANEYDLMNDFMSFGLHRNWKKEFVDLIEINDEKETTALAKASKPYLNENAALLTLTYLGSIQTLPNYNVMGLAKASLEANTRFLAASMGKDSIRVNAISAGPIKTLAASGVKNFRKMLSQHSKRAPLGRTVTADEVGNVAAFLCSDYASGVTGEITYVDAGFNISAMPLDELEE